ncbi:uncharacterized protein (UPF0335 family) [Rhizobium azooxidifex]|uniref:Uncharacterized protein (UPF0335 family) n=1 Tax=Mycoplana azooxidifex TaxID=1636188 RepID=A0A7W6GMC5_9HYPH|nr:DUF2312 domain-containing protein [Mycoplana azooxidifex]MBB3980133.1 uncharacterized protein (UPF0335 family) [Mycoplana azooxidifex]
MSTIGHNSVAGKELGDFIDRIERLESEKAELAGDIRDVYGELKGRGYDAKTVRKIVRMRKQDANKRAEEEALTETYLHALGML